MNMNMVINCSNEKSHHALEILFTWFLLIFLRHIDMCDADGNQWDWTTNIYRNEWEKRHRIQHESPENVQSDSVDSRKIHEWKKIRKNIMNAGDEFLTWLFMNAQACAYKEQRFAPFVPIWSVAFEAIVFKIKTNQKGLSFFYFSILKIHVEMVWFGLFSLWNRTALLSFILIFCGLRLKSIKISTEKMRLGNCKRYKRFQRRAGIPIKLNIQNHFFGLIKYQLP